MGRFVVLLRGVNVGKGSKVPMAGLRAALEELGHTGVQTVLNSGNAVFSSGCRSPARLATDIASALQARFGVITPVIVKSAAEFAAIVTNNPIAPPESENSRFLVAFAMDRAKLQELAVLRLMLQPGERLAVTEHAAYLHCASGLLQSKAGGGNPGQERPEHHHSQLGHNTQTGFPAWRQRDASARAGACKLCMPETLME